MNTSDGMVSIPLRRKTFGDWLAALQYIPVTCWMFVSLFLMSRKQRMNVSKSVREKTVRSDRFVLMFQWQTMAWRVRQEILENCCAASITTLHHSVRMIPRTNPHPWWRKCLLSRTPSLLRWRGGSFSPSFWDRADLSPPLFLTCRSPVLLTTVLFLISWA